MTKKELDSVVGKVWRHLKENGSKTIDELQKETQFTKEEIILSIGWLIQEDNIEKTIGGEKKMVRNELNGIVGEIWKYLNENGEKSVSRIVKDTGISNKDVLLSLGWLMQEDNVESKKKGRSEVYYLKS